MCRLFRKGLRWWLGEGVGSRGSEIGRRGRNREGRGVMDLASRGMVDMGAREDNGGDLGIGVDGFRGSGRCSVDLVGGEKEWGAVLSPSAFVIPNAAQGLHVLLVDHDTNCLMHMASVLQQKSYKVTTTGHASMALTLIREREFPCDLVIAEVDMPDMSGFTLLNQILLIKQDIAIILMSSNGGMEIAIRALNEGACFFLFKPASPQDLIRVWQHVFSKRGQSTNLSNVAENNKENQTLQIEKSCDEDDNAQTFYRDPNKGKAPCLDEGMKKPKNVVHNKEKLIFGGIDKRPRDGIDLGKRKNVEKFGKEKKDDGNGKRAKDDNLGKMINVEKGRMKKDCDDESSPKKRSPRMTWTAELHEKFLQAYARLGEYKAQPRTILKEMDVPDLERRHVASHLQKHRMQTKKIREKLLKDPPMFESIILGRPTPPLLSLMLTKPSKYFHSLNPSTFGPPKIAYPPPQNNLNRGTAYYQMDRLKSLFSNKPTTNLPRTSSNHYFRANSGNQELPVMNPQLNYVNSGNQELPIMNPLLNSADQSGNQVVYSFGGNNNNNSNIANNNATPSDYNFGINNIDALIESWKNELAGALGSDPKLHQEVDSLAKYNNVVVDPPQSLKNEPPSIGFSTACEELAPAEARDRFNMEEQNYSYEEIAKFFDDSYGGCEGVKGPSSETPKESLANNDNGNVADMMKGFETEDYTEFLNIFSDYEDDLL
ncbi:hypothetical protein ACH5RR_030102 [Cinchona calisaya]|uniref:Response regulatory domain-containing protein n=1 Tax=Cinchona calisaya TaxID=153742 RepID=A0ABD2YVV0_9GENT